ncbi:MAG: DNA-3-methyladenine glycosylase 2 family protein [Candidatus Methanoperedens sp.]|nr:DNA-3-methyladenine glycosylase 2 family protein [Candidatus Methanoperedens sp.]
MYSIRTVDFDLNNTLSCGQVFRWQKNQWWTGVIKGTLVRAKQDGDELSIDSSLEKIVIQDYFRLDDDMQQIYSSINCDVKIASLIKNYRGLRLIRQEPWECLVSYICSSNNTIRNITNSIRRLCECFGERIENGYYSFPSPEALSMVKLCDMEPCRMGFRASRVIEIASRIAQREFDLEGIESLSFEEGRRKLLKINGVGNKIADCVLLFAFGKLESFPVDTHIEQIMGRLYGEHIKCASKNKKRDEIAKFARRYFGTYCGYAQEYLYLEDLGRDKHKE